MIEVLEENDQRNVLRIRGTVDADSYDKHNSWFQQRASGPIWSIGMLVLTWHCQGREGLDAAWTDPSLSMHLTEGFGEGSTVEESAWQKCIAKLSRQLLPTELRWFNTSQAEDARFRVVPLDKGARN